MNIRSDDEAIGIVAGILIAMVIIFFAGLFIGSMHEEDYYQNSAVKAGYAEYNSITGDWQWKERN